MCLLYFRVLRPVFIKEIKPRVETQVRINQFVDDTQLFVRNETSPPHIFNELSNYEKASGAKMNKDKTVGLCIGTLKGKNPEYKEIKWSDTNFKTLGVYHGHSISEDNIWRDKINKIKCALHVWKSRNLAIEGKLLLLITFVFSIIMLKSKLFCLIFCGLVKNMSFKFMVLDYENLSIGLENFPKNNKNKLIKRHQKMCFFTMDICF